MSAKARLNMELPQVSRDLLEDLVERTSAGSMSEVVKKAIALYDVLLVHQQGGGDVVLRKGDQVERLVIL